jgi:hypothetical protein
MTAFNATTSFDRRELLKASGVLAIGFSVSFAAGSGSAAGFCCARFARWNEEMDERSARRNHRGLIH